MLLALVRLLANGKLQVEQEQEEEEQWPTGGHCNHQEVASVYSAFGLAPHIVVQQ